MRTVAAALLVAAVLLASPTRVDAADPGARCSTAAADVSACRDRGWIIRPRLHVGPHGYVQWFRGLDRCARYGDGKSAQAPVSECWTNARRSGRPGPSYVDLGHGLILEVNGYACHLRADRRACR